MLNTAEPTGAGADGTTMAASAASSDSMTEEDPWAKRVESTGCQNENTALQRCYFEHKDWRLCKGEMEAFRTCYDAYLLRRRLARKAVVTTGSTPPLDTTLAAKAL